jgi:hypothetical protein
MPRRRDEDDEYEDDRPRRRRRRDDEDEEEYEERPRRRSRRYEPEEDPFAFAEQEAEEKRRRRERDRDRYGPPQPTNGTATTALIFGILSLVGGLTAIPGLIAGVMGMKKAKRVGVGHGVALTGTILSGVGVLVLAGTAYFVYWYLGPRETREVAVNNVANIGIAMHNYHDARGVLPLPYAVPDDFMGNQGEVLKVPKALGDRLSWRVTMLPQLGQDPLYRKFKMTQAWNSPTNLPLASTVVSEYADRGETDTDTRYRVFVGRETVFPDASSGGVRLAEITDGRSNTIMIVETPDKVKWPQFNEVPFDSKRPPLPASLGKAEADRFLVVMADGSVKYARKTMTPQVLSALITRASGEVVSDDWNR